MISSSALLVFLSIAFIFFCVSLGYLNGDNSFSIFRFLISSITLVICIVFVLWALDGEVYYSVSRVEYGEVNTIKSIEYPGLSKSYLKIFTTDSNNIVQVKECTLDLDANTDVTSSDFDVCDGDAILSDSDKKVVEKVTVTRTKTIDYHCPLVKNVVEQETITYYIIYYPLDELNVNK